MTRRRARRPGATDDAEPPAGDSSPEPEGDEPGDHAIGRSRGGLTTKVHALCDGAGRPLVVLLTAGNVHDSPVFAPLIAALRVGRPRPGRPRTRPDYVVADKGYSSTANRGLLRARGIGHTIPEKADQAAHRRRRGSAGGRPPGFDPDRYARRNTIERGFCQLKQWRGLATRYDKHARNYAGALSLAALLTWLP
jgi:transposase